MKRRKYDLSLVVCVADDKRIEKLLKSIKDKCEIVVVMNGPSEEVRRIVNDFGKTTENEFKVVEIPDRNLSKARNVGMQNAKYNKVVFYDSDCVVVKGALGEYDNYLDKYMLVDGRVEFKSDNFQSKIVSLQRGFGLPGYALCPSIGMHKNILEHIDYYFDEDIKWIEDSEMNNRAKKKGIEVGTIDKLTCIHDNLSFRQDLRSGYKYGTGAKIAVRKGIREKGHLGNWDVTKLCFKESILGGIYSIIWNFSFILGYVFS